MEIAVGGKLLVGYSGTVCHKEQATVGKGVLVQDVLGADGVLGGEEGLEFRDGVDNSFTREGGGGNDVAVLILFAEAITAVLSHAKIIIL